MTVQEEIWSFRDQSIGVRASRLYRREQQRRKFSSTAASEAPEIRECHSNTSVQQTSGRICSASTLVFEGVIESVSARKAGLNLESEEKPLIHQPSIIINVVCDTYKHDLRHTSVYLASCSALRRLAVDRVSIRLVPSFASGYLVPPGMVGSPLSPTVWTLSHGGSDRAGEPKISIAQQDHRQRNVRDTLQEWAGLPPASGA